MGPGARLPRLPALYEKKTFWRLPEQYNALDYQEERAAAEGVWRSNYSSLAGLADKVEAVMGDQAERGQKLRLKEKEASTVASLGANKKEKSTGEITASPLRWHSWYRRQQKNTSEGPGERTHRCGHQTVPPREGPVRTSFVRAHSRCDGGPQAGTHRPSGLALPRSTDTSWGLGICQQGGDLRDRICLVLVVKSSKRNWQDRSVIPVHSVHTWHLLVVDDYMRMRQARHTEKRSFLSSRCARSLAYRYHGRKQQEEILSAGSDLRYSTERASWVLANGGVSGSSAGHGRWLSPTTYR